MAEDAAATYVTLGASLWTGIIDVGETIVDGAVQLVGGGAACIVGLIDEEAGDAMKKGVQDFVSYDASGALYDTFVEVAGIDEDIAYGWAHTAGNITGQVVGYAAISMIPGGAAVVAGAGALAAAGASAESAYAKGATFEETMVVSAVAGLAGAATGGAANKLQGVAAGSKTLTQVAGYTAAGAAVGTAEPIVNSGVEYLTYGNNDGKSYIEYMNESGGWLNLAIGAGAGGLSTGAQSFAGYKANTKPVEVVNKLESSTMDRIKNKMYLDKQGKMSDQYAFEVYKNSIDDAIQMARQNGNKDIENMLEKLYLLQKERPDFAIKFDSNNGAFSDAYNSGSISLGADVLLGNRKGVVYHELGHTLHGVVNNSQVPLNYMDVKGSIYNHMSHNTDYVASVMDYFQNSQNLAIIEATKHFDNNLSNSVIDKLNQTNWDEVADYYRKAGFNENQIQDFINTDFSNQYNNIRNSEIMRIADDYQRDWGVDAASDIVGSVFDGNKRFAVLDTNGNKVYLGGDTTYSHSKEYYTTVEYTDGTKRYKTTAEINEASFHEQIANFTQLKLSGNTSTLDVLKNLLGNDWYQMMENEFANITNYFK